MLLSLEATEEEATTPYTQTTRKSVTRKFLITTVNSSTAQTNQGAERGNEQQQLVSEVTNPATTTGENKKLNMFSC